MVLSSNTKSKYMYKTFSRSFKMGETEIKKFYFMPVTTGNETIYNVHINGDPEIKKFKMNKDDSGHWKIHPTDLKSWLYTLEQPFNHEIEYAAANHQK
jgi:hypothetical protein